MIVPVLPTAADCDVCHQPITSDDLVRRHAKRHRGACLTRWRTERSRRFYHENRASRMAYAAAYRDANQGEVRTARRLRRLASYGLTEESYRALHDRQGGVCAVCRCPETRILRGHPAPLAVDHDHETGRVRGLLCARCNSVLGFLEQPGWMAAAGAYLQAAASREVN